MEENDLQADAHNEHEKSVKVVDPISAKEGEVASDAKRLRDIFLEFSTSTTTHGPGKIAEKRELWAKLLWASVFTAGLCVVIYFLYGLIGQFFSYPTATSVEIGVDVLEFPSVTICNANPYRASRLDTVPGLRKALEKFTTRKASSLSSRSSYLTTAGTTISGLNLSTTSHTLSGSATTGKKLTEIPLATAIDPSDGIYAVNVDYARYTWFDTTGSSSVDAEAKKSISKLLTLVPRKRKEAMGYQLADMLQECSFAGRSCTPVDFTQIFNRKYGNCFTFNSGYNEEVRKISQPGSEYGLSLTLLIDQTEYLGALAQQAGIKVAVHRQGTFPFPEDDAVSIPPGFKGAVSINYVNITRPPSPYTDCVDDNSIPMFYPGNYTREGCRKTCLQKHILNKCSCGGSAYPLPSGRHHCATKSEERCLDKTVASYKAGDLICDQCVASCSDSLYTTTLSLAEWPSDPYVNVLANALSGRQLVDRALSKGTSSLRQQLCSLEVYFSSLSYPWYDDQPSYLGHNLLSDIGGDIGLWVGMSLISVSEFIELLIKISYYSTKRCFRRKPTKEQTLSITEIATTNVADSERTASTGADSASAEDTSPPAQAI